MTIRVENLSKRFGNNWALRDVDVEIGNGEIFGVFGGNASGKTALLRCIAGLETAIGGSVDLGGAKAHLACESNKEGGLASIFGKKQPAASTGETRLASLENLLDELTGEGEVLLLDECFAGIDAENTARLVARIRELASKGTTVVIASTEFEHLAPLCQRMLVLDRGYVRQTGRPKFIYEHPESAAVAAIAGKNNLFAARRLSSTNADLPEFMTIDGGHRIFAQATEKNRLGAINQNIMLAIRPEQISISFGASFPEDNLIKAIVTGFHFQGETTLIDLDADGLKLEARVFRVVGLEPGAECMVSLPPDRIQVLKD